MIEIQRRPEVDISVLPAHLPDLLKRIYVSRGVNSADQLETAAKGLHSYQKLGGIDAAVELLFNAIQHQKRIIVVATLMPMVQPALRCRYLRCVC